MEDQESSFKPYVADESKMAEFTVKSILFGAIFGILFGASTVYLALKAGLTVSASIPVAVIAITLGRKFLKTTILENNIIQTAGSAGESIAAGVAFALPAFLFLSPESSGASYFEYWTILVLATAGGLLGVFMMIPLRRSLIVKEHKNLPYPEGTACAAVLEAGEKGGVMAKTAFVGMGVAMIYAILQKVFHLIAETPTFVTRQANKFWPSATINADVTPEYLGVGYIIGARISGVLVAGSVLAWWALIPLLVTLVDGETIATQLSKLSFHLDSFGWDPVSKTFTDPAKAIYAAYIKQIGAGAVATGGLITLIKTLPTIVSSFKSSVASLNDKEESHVSRTDRDISFKTVLIGSAVLVLIVSLLPIIPIQGVFQRILIGILVVVFGFFFVTVSSRIVGLIGTTNNPVSGMTIATLMGTCLIFTAVGWTGYFYEPMALVVGGMICIAASNAGDTSQDLKTGYLIGATPKYQQYALFVGAIVSSLVIGWIIILLDSGGAEGTHAIGTAAYPAPQATLIATLVKGILSFNLDWQYVIVGSCIALTLELCRVSALAFSIGLYLPLSTTLPIFIGGAIKGFVDWRTGEKEEGSFSELKHGNLFATGLVAGGALTGVVVAILYVLLKDVMQDLSLLERIMATFGDGGYQWFGAIAFSLLCLYLYKTALKKNENDGSRDSR